jgi:hypothetical protein
MLLLLVLLAVPVWGQVADANVVGTITDQTNAAVPEADIVLEHMETAVRYTARTDTAGNYRFANIPVGRYRLTATKAGFTTQTIQNIDLQLNRTSTVNVTMAIGAVATTVEVIDSAALIDTTTATVQTTYNTKTATQMPISGIGTMGVINLSLLSAGVTSSGGVGYGRGPSVGGQRPTNNNFMVEGVDNNDRSITGPVVEISNEYVQEFSVQQNQFNPEFGHSTGGQFNTVVRGGTNEFHGSLFWYLQNRKFNAVDESFARQGIRKHPRYDQNRIGASIGGPVIKNRIFFFGGFQYTPIGEASTSPGAIFGPTADGIRMLEGLPGISRRNLDYFKQWVPVAGSSSRTVTVANTAIPVGALTATGPAFQNTYHPAVSLDIHASDRDHIRLRWLHTAIDSINTTGVAIPTFYTPITQRNHIASAAYFRNFTPNITNELRFGWNRKEDARPIDESWQFPGLDALPNVEIRDISMQIGPNSNYPQGGRYGTYQLADNVSWVLNRHTLKFGYDGRKVNASNFFVQRFRGDYIYQSFERYLLDITPEFAQRSGGGFPFIGNMLSHYLYVNDEWRLRPNLTLNVGLRYEYVGVPVGTQSQELNALASVPGLLEFAAPEPTTKDFAPRIGIAWSPGTSGRTAIRAGFGMAYDQFYHNLGLNALPPQYFTTIDAHIEQANQQNFLANGGIRARLVSITDPATARRLTSSYIPIVQKRPYSLQWNTGVSQVFGEDYTLEVRYLGTRGVHLPFQLQLNRPAAVNAGSAGLPVFYERPSQAQIDALTTSLADVTARRPVHPLIPAGFTTTITSFTPQGNSWYHGLATQLTRRFANGLQFTGAYTWSHNIDDSTATLASTLLTPRRPQDFFDIRSEKADSALDRRHRFSIGWVYEMPWYRTDSNWLLKNVIGNWTFSGTYIAETGAWMTPQSGVDSNLNGDAAGDRSIINPNGTDGVGSPVTPLCRTGTATCSTAAGRAGVVGYLVTNPNAKYIQAGEGVFPNGGRNTLRLPGINNFDLALGKRINITESKSIQFRAEAYNALNNSQYTAGFPSVASLRSRTTGGVAALTLVGNAVFNRPDLAFQSNARQMQFALRFEF